METLDGTTSLVTGASRGIGRAIAKRLAAAGSLVVVHYGTSAAAAQETVAQITEAGGAAFAVGAQFGVAGDADRLWAGVEAGLAERGVPRGIDVLVNNAAIGGATPTLATARPDDFDELFAINVKAPFFVIQRGVNLLRDGGRIVNVSSVATRVAIPGTLAYAMTKGAINTLSVTLAQELGGRGITVNAVTPGDNRHREQPRLVRRPTGATRGRHRALGLTSCRRAGGYRGRGRLPCLSSREMGDRPGDRRLRWDASRPLHRPGAAGVDGTEPLSVCCAWQEWARRTPEGEASANEFLDGGRGDRSEEVDEVAVGVTEQQ